MGPDDGAKRRIAKHSEDEVLVVHAVAETARRLEKSLEGVASNPTVRAASTLSEAVEAVEGCSPKVVFLGLTLADSSGLATLRTLRGKCPTLPIIVLVNDDPVEGAEALANGAQDYIGLSEIGREVISRAITRAVARRKVEEGHSEIAWRSGIGETLLGLRHEINNPLASLMLNVEMLKEGGHEDTADLVEGIETAARRIAAIVRRLEGPRAPQLIPAIGETFMDESRNDAAANVSAQKSGSDRQRPPAAAGSTILLVDDEESVRAVVSKILVRHGHKVLEAEHGAAAVRIAAGYEGQIDLLITDMYMPGLRGPEILEKLAPTRPGLTVLFMSGYADEDIARSGVNPGAAFLRKPFSVQELSEAVEKALSQRESSPNRKPSGAD